MLFSLQINANRCDQTITAKEFAVDHQYQQFLGNGPLHELFQFFGRSGFPVPADAGAPKSIAFKALVNGSLIISSRALASHLTAHGLLHFPVLLKRLITAQRHLFSILATQARSLQSDLATSKDYIASLVTMSQTALLAPFAKLAFDLRFHDLLDDRQAQLGGIILDVFANSSDQLLHRKLRLQGEPCLVLCFLFGLFYLCAILSHYWFSWLFVIYYNRSSCLMNGRRTTSNFNYRRDIPCKRNWKGELKG